MNRSASFLLLVTLGCGAPSPAEQATARESLLQADRDFDAAVAAAGLEAWVRVAADSGRQTDRYGDFVVGPGAIRDLMRGLLTDTTSSLRWTPDFAEVSADLTLGYTWGRWTFSRRDSTGAFRQTGQGRYLTVWRRQPDGAWKMEADIGTDTERSD